MKVARGIIGRAYSRQQQNNPQDLGDPSEWKEDVDLVETFTSQCYYRATFDSFRSNSISTL